MRSLTQVSFHALLVQLRSSRSEGRSSFHVVSPKWKGRNLPK